MGVTGSVDGRRIAIGNQRLMEEVGAPVQAFLDRADALRGQCAAPASCENVTVTRLDPSKRFK